MTLLLAGLIILLAAACQAVTGFGSALVAVPLLTILFGPRPAVAIGLVMAVLLSIGVSIAERRHISRREALLMSLSGLIGAPVGLLVVKSVSDRTLTVVIAAVLVAAAAMLYFGFRVPAKPAVAVGAGVLSGALLTSTSLNGPPLAVALQAQRMDRLAMRATLACVFVVHGVVGVTLFAVSGEVTGSVLGAGLVALPAPAIGWVLGDRLSARMSGKWFERAMLGMLVVSAVVAVATT